MEVGERVYIIRKFLEAGVLDEEIRVLLSKIAASKTDDVQGFLWGLYVLLNLKMKLEDEVKVYEGK